jgi:cyanate lyase
MGVLRLYHYPDRRLMSAAEVTSLIAQITTSVVAIIAAVASLISVFRVDDLKTQTHDKAVQVDVKLDEIHTLTNSTLTGVRAELALAADKIGELQAIVVKLSEDSRGPTEDETRTAATNIPAAKP